MKKDAISFNYGIFDKKHKANIRKNLKAVEELFQSAANKGAHIGDSSGFSDSDKPFFFKDYPKVKKQMDELMDSVRLGLQGIIETGDREEWLLSCEKNDALINMTTSSTKLPKSQISQWKAPNLEALAAFQGRVEAGMGLSDRVWRIAEQFKQELELALDIGLGEGKSAAELSRDVRKYLNEPNRLFRRVRDKHGILRLSKAAEAYHPGRGVYRSSYKNALRLTATENNMAYRKADSERWKQIPFVIGIRISISHNSHPCVDICDTLQGVYPKDFVWLGWHPFCRCAAVTELAKKDEFMDYQKKLLNGEDVSNYKFSGQVEEVPGNYKKWFEENGERISQAASIPYFIRDNIKYTPSKWKNDVAEAIDKLDYNLMPDLNSTKFSVKNLTSISDQEVIGIIKDVDKANPGLFKGGLKEVRIIDTDQGFMANERASGTNILYISNKTFTVPGGREFNPLNELKGAMANIAKNKKDAVLTFNQEYALESLWHEIRHASAFGWKNVANKAGDLMNSMELINQFCARKSYKSFVQSLGGKASHEKKIMEKGYGYAISVQNFCFLLKKMDISQKNTYKYFKDIIVTKPYEEIKSELIKFVTDKGKIKMEEAKELVKDLSSQPKMFKKSVSLIMDE